MRNPATVLFEAIKSLFSKPVTSEYPKKKRDIHTRYSGMISFEQNKCIGCQICVRNCPANAIRIKKIGDKLFSCELSLANCIFCSQCVFTCPKKALHTTDNFELAQIDKSKLTVKLEELTPQAEIKKEEPLKTKPATEDKKESASAVTDAKTVSPQPQQGKSEENKEVKAEQKDVKKEIAPQKKEKAKPASQQQLFEDAEIPSVNKKNPGK